MPRDVAAGLPEAASALHRYAAVFDAVEINSSFHRPHRPATYARWAASVPDDFRFSVKLPRTVTHDAGLEGAEAAIDRFLDETSALGSKRGPVLVQTPPKLAFDPSRAGAVVSRLAAGGVSAIAWEPRHASWFDERRRRLAGRSPRCPRRRRPGAPRGGRDARRLARPRLLPPPRLAADVRFTL